jgi:hypothetical protein
MRRFSSAGALLAVLLLVAACGGGEPSPAPGDPVAAVTEPTTKTQRESLGAAGEGGTSAPDVSGTTLDGEPASLDDFRGRPVFVKVFAGY